MLWIRWIFLLPFFILFWLVLSAFTRISSGYRRFFLTLSLAAALMVLGTAFWGRWTHSFELSFILNSLSAALGIAVLRQRKDPRPKSQWKIQWSWGLLAVLLFIVSTTIMVSSIALRFDFHDQLRTQGHLPLVESMLRGNFPPHMMVFPQIPLKYHYGGDLFSAILAWVMGISAHRAIDIAMIYGWIAMVGCLYTFCREWGLKTNFSAIALLWVLLAAGWVYLLTPWLTNVNPRPPALLVWPDSYRVFQRHLNPGTVDNWFMLPYSLGTPLLFASLALLTHWTQHRSQRLLFWFSLLLASLSLIQVTFFVTLLSSTIVILLLQPHFEKIPWRETFKTLLLLLSTVIILTAAVGGFFTHSADYASRLLVFNWPPGYLRNATWGGETPIRTSQAFLWYLSTFGSLVFLSIPFLFLGLRSLKQNYQPILLLLILYAVQCWGVTQGIRYRFTWDIIKWFTGFHISMVLIVVYLWSEWRFKKIFVGFLLALFMVLDTLPSIRFLGSLAFFQPWQLDPSHRRWWSTILKKPTPALEIILEELKKGPWNEAVLSTPYFSENIADHSGQAMASLDLNTPLFGIKNDFLRERNYQIQTLEKNFNIQILKDSSIRWIVFPCGDFEKVFSQESREKIAEAVQNGELAAMPVNPPGECWKVFHLKSSEGHGNPLTSLKQ